MLTRSARVVKEDLGAAASLCSPPQSMSSSLLVANEYGDSPISTSQNLDDVRVPVFLFIDCAAIAVNWGPGPDSEELRKPAYWKFIRSKEHALSMASRFKWSGRMSRPWWVLFMREYLGEVAADCASTGRHQIEIRGREPIPH